MNPDRIKVFTGNANIALAEEICQHLGIDLGQSQVKGFADGESNIQIQENVRGADVFVVQPTCTPVDHHIMELLFMTHALKLSSAGRITAVLPYYGYARQDRKDKPRVPISAMVAGSAAGWRGAGDDRGRNDRARERLRRQPGAALGNSGPASLVSGLRKYRQREE